MCSIIQQAGARSAAARLAALTAHSLEVNGEITELLADPDVAAELAAVGSLAGDGLAEQVTTLLASADRATAAATVLTGQVDAGSGRSTGSLIAGRYATTVRFLEVEAGLSPTSARGTVGRTRDLRGDYACLVGPWLAGAVSGDAVREVTLGVGAAIRHSTLPAAEREGARSAALEIVLPVAERGTVADVRRALSHLTLVTNPDGAAQAAMDAFDDQSLTVEQVGAMVRLTAWLTVTDAAAVMTVLTAKVDARRRAGDLSAAEQVPDGADPDTWDGRRLTRQRQSHLLAVALGETFTALLDDSQIGSHHGIAPHVTVTLDLARLEAGLGGDLTLPGSDASVPVPNATVERILCDSDLTTVITRRQVVGDRDLTDPSRTDPDRHWRALPDLLLDASREVLYVGRTQRVVPPRLRRALETRDRHCVFPGCRAHVRRCHAHHVTEWEHGGRTELDNTVLLCVRHHHAVHEGGWTLTRTPSTPPGATGCWQATPPGRRPRP